MAPLRLLLGQLLHVAAAAAQLEILKLQLTTDKIQEHKNFRYFLGQLSVAFAKCPGQEVDAETHNSRVAQQQQRPLATSLSLSPRVTPPLSLAEREKETFAYPVTHL